MTDINWVGLAIFGAVIVGMNVFVFYQWHQLDKWNRAHPQPRAAWMFEDNPKGTLFYDMQMLRLASARIVVAARKTLRISRS